MKSKFQPDVDPGVSAHPLAMLVDPEAYDASEQQFAASVEGKGARPRFVVDAEGGVEEITKAAGEALPQPGADRNTAVPAGTAAERRQVAAHGASRGTEAESASAPGGRTTAVSNQSDKLDPARASGNLSESDSLDQPAPSSLQTELLPLQDSGSWRREVTARVNTYQARRRPRAPHYPSLQLKFEPAEPSRTTRSCPGQPAVPVSSHRLAAAMQEPLPAPQVTQSLQPETDATRDHLGVSESGARILEFPRSAAAPPPLLDELAEPIVDRPRILEAPELLPPPPALGGILIEPVEQSAKERRPGFELPLQAAPMSRRLWAGAIDSLLVVAAFAVFAYIFIRVTLVVPPLQPALELSAALIAAFWTAYQYLLLVHTGTTPGLKLSKLRLSRFDGNPVPRKLRRWRVLASILSGMSLALGYAWCFLDEDRLCWHDRITRTYMAPQRD